MCEKKCGPSQEELEMDTAVKKLLSLLLRSATMFDNDDERDLVNIGYALADYLFQENIHRIAFIDRSARPAYVCLQQAWRKKYPTEKIPEIYFFNPDGFTTMQHLDAMQRLDPRDNDITPLPRMIYDAVRQVREKKPGLPMEIIMKLFIADEMLSILREAPSDQDAVTFRLQRDFPNLFLDKQSPLLVFDTCRHSGKAWEPIQNGLEGAGFTDVRLGLASHSRDFSQLAEPDFIALTHEPSSKCYPFEHDTLLEKNRHCLFSNPTEFEFTERRHAHKIRENIRKAFNT